MQIRARHLIDTFETFAPKSLAMEKDPVGLHIGNLDQTVTKVMVTLDVRPEVVQEAIDNNVDFIFAHHPPIFSPIKRFDTAVPQNKMYEQLIKHDIVVYAAHTNLDVAKDGMNDWLANALGLQDVEVLVKEEAEEIGLGRIGNLRQAMPLVDFFDIIKESFKVKHFRYVSDDIYQNVQRVAILGGDGGDYYLEALKRGADVYVTGDVYYHTAHDMQAADLTVIDPGHHIESIVKPQMSQKFKTWAKANNWEVDIIASEINTDPFKFI